MIEILFKHKHNAYVQKKLMGIRTGVEMGPVRSPINNPPLHIIEDIVQSLQKVGFFESCK
jgi:hypothetical protein